MAASPSRSKASVASLLAVVGVLAATGESQAAAVTVSPISIEMTGTSDALLTIQNREARQTNAQVRVFRWTQNGEGDQLEPATDLVASPPIVQVGPKASYTVRLHRQGEGEPAGEQAFRVVVDELPDLNRQRNGAINVLLRYSLPLFVNTPDSSQPRLQWHLETGQQGPMLAATNDGDKRIQIRSLSLKGGKRVVQVAPGLAGYVLGHSTRAWPLPNGAAATAGLRVSAGSDHGPIDVALRP